MFIKKIIGNNIMDERQLQIRYKLCTQCLWLTIAAIIINACVKNIHVWATPMVEAVVLIMIPAAYYGVAGAIKGITFTKDYKKDMLFNKLYYFSAGLIIFAEIMHPNRFTASRYIENGMVSDDGGMLIQGLFFLTMGIGTSIGYKINKQDLIEE